MTFIPPRYPIYTNGRLIGTTPYLLPQHTESRRLAFVWEVCGLGAVPKLTNRPQNVPYPQQLATNYGMLVDGIVDADGDVRYETRHTPQIASHLLWIGSGAGKPCSLPAGKITYLPARSHLKLR